MASSPGPRSRQSGLRTRRLELAPVAESDYTPLYKLLVASGPGIAWRFRDQAPSPDEFVKGLWEDVLVQQVIRRRSDDSIIGLAVLYQANFRDRHAVMSLYLGPEATLRGYSLEAGAAFIKMVFHRYDFVKIYGRNPGYTHSQFRRGAGGPFQVEAVLKDHEWYLGRYWDMYLVAIYREEWESATNPLLKRLRLD